MPIDGVRILAHRGGMITSPENTLEAVARAKDEGADGVELDVRLCAGGEPVIFHDRDASRVAGRRAAIAELSWSEVRALRVFGKHRVPHLDDVLSALEDWPGAHLSLDLHEESLSLASAVARRVGASRVRDRVSVLDFYSRRATLLRVREEDPRVRLAVMPGAPWNTDPAVRNLSPTDVFLGWDRPWTWFLYRAACRCYDVRAAIQRARDAGVGVAGGVANTPEQIRYCLSQGVDGIWTDDLALARATLSSL